MLEGVEWIQAIILGLVQGLTEFLPISSSAHLRIVGQLLPEKADPGAAFTAITQLGTETAVLLSPAGLSAATRTRGWAGSSLSVPSPSAFSVWF